MDCFMNKTYVIILYYLFIYLLLSRIHIVIVTLALIHVLKSRKRGFYLFFFVICSVYLFIYVYENFDGCFLFNVQGKQKVPPVHQLF